MRQTEAQDPSPVLSGEMEGDVTRFVLHSGAGAPGGDVTVNQSGNGRAEALRSAGDSGRGRITIVGVLAWLVLIGLTGAGLYAGQKLMRAHWDARMLSVTSSPDEIRAALAAPAPAGANADYFETLAELAIHQRRPELAAAERAARRAIELDPSRANAWAMIAFVQRERDGRFTQDGLAALERSMALCPLCNDDLIRWRFNMVLANWAQVPEPMRRAAFEHADRLRWTGEHAEFLAEMRIKSEAAGIPYAAYRAGVRSPVASLDKGLSDPAASPDPGVTDPAPAP